MMLHPVFSDIAAILPEVALALGGMGLMIVGAFGRGGAFGSSGALAVALLAAVALYLGLGAGGGEAQRVFGDMLVIDGFSRFARILIAGGGIAALLIARSSLPGTVMARFEYPVLVVFSTLGMFVMAGANDFLTLYVGLELSSLCLYVLAAFDRNSTVSAEAGLKYFVLGAISSGLLLFGISLIYGYAGSTQFDLIHATLSAAAVPGHSSVVVLFGMVLIISALAFKIAAVPFHMWTPDVYEGAPTAVTAFFAIVPKFAAAILLMRLLAGPFGALGAEWAPVIAALSVASMLIGSFAGIVQTGLKRLIAYSSIGNIGYALLGLVAGSHEGLAATLVYLVIYMVTTAGLFALLTLLRLPAGGEVVRIADLAGLGKKHPAAAYGVAVLMFSMAGIPPVAGFFGKYAVFLAAVSSGAYVLAVIGVLTSVIAAWYYINIIRVMFFEDAGADAPVFAGGAGGRVVVVCALAFVVLYALCPQPLVGVAELATAPFIR